MKRSLKLNFILNLIKTLSSLIFPLITFAYASRILSVTGLGKISFAQSVISYFTLFATLGITTYGIREGAKCRDNKQAFSKLAKELFLINLITTITAYLLFGLSLFLVPKFQEYKYLLLINGLTIGFTALGLDWVYTALEEYLYITLRSVLFQVISFLLMIMLVKKPSDIYIYAFIVVFANAGSNIMNFIHARHYIDFKTSGKLYIKRHIKPIGIFFAATLAGNIYISLDTTMLGFLSSEYSIGLYSASIKITRVISSLITSVCAILLPRLTYYLQNNDLAHYKKLLKKAFDCIFMLSLPCCIGIFMIADVIILLFSGEEFMPALTCTRMMSVIIIAISLSSTIANQILVPIGKEHIHLYITITGAAVNVILNSLLIPLLQHTGAAIATIIAELMVAALAFVLALRYFDFKFALKNLWHYILAAFIMGIVILPFSMLLQGIVKCICCIFIGALTYAVTLFMLKDEFFVENILNIKNKIISKIPKKR